MKVQGGCYCGAIRYEANGDPMMRAECYCRECQYITGGANVLVMAMPIDGFTLVKGAVKGFTRDDIEHAVTREFCEHCGTHLFTRAPRFKEGVIIKVGSMDDPSLFGKADSANHVSDALPHHRLPDDIPLHQKWMHS